MPHVVQDHTIHKTVLAERREEPPAARPINPGIESRALRSVAELDAAAAKFVDTLLGCIATHRALVSRFQNTNEIAYARVAEHIEAAIFSVPDGILNRAGLSQDAIRELLRRRGTELNRLVEEKIF